jgi:hypothetical protein
MVEKIISTDELWGAVRSKLNLNIRKNYSFAQAGGRLDQVNSQALMDEYVADCVAKGGDLNFSGGGTYNFDFSSYALPKIGVKGDGSATLQNVVWRLGNDGDKQDWHRTWGGVRVLQTGAGVAGVKLGAVRDFSFEESAVFEGMDKAIFSLSTTASQFHSIGGISVRSKFINVGYAGYFEKGVGVTLLVVNDVKYLGCYANVITKTFVWGEEVDGFTSDGLNQVFFRRPTSSVQANSYTNGNCIYMKGAPIVTIGEGNHFFEPGEEAILLEDCADITIGPCQILSPGQLKPRPGIRISNPNVYARISIVSPNIVNSTRNLVELNTPVGWSGCVSGVGGSVDLRKALEPGSGGNGPKTYWGVETGQGAMVTNQFSVSQVGNSLSSTGRIDGSAAAFADLSGTVVRLNDSHDVRTAQDYPVRYAGRSARLASVTFSGGVAAPVFTCYSSTNNQISVAGEITLIVKNADADIGASLKSSVHKLLLHIDGNSGSRTLTSMASAGSLTGGAANDPSFTFTINSGNQIVATPVGSTSGNFIFYATTQGNCKLSRI